MTTSTVEQIPMASDVRVTTDELLVTLQDGRRISVPLVWFPRLANAEASDQQTFELIGDGEGIHWPTLDEDISVAGLLK